MKATTPISQTKPWRLPRARTVQLIIAVAVLFWSGFFTLSFLLHGVLTWPQASRVLTLTLVCILLAYEFVYKEAKSYAETRPGSSPMRTVCYACLIPYMLGGMTLLVLMTLI